MKSEPDYYIILQVDPRAEPEVIQAAYRRLAAKHHPDVDPSPEAMERMKLLNAAYEVLSDPVKRREHDMSRLRGQQQTIGDTSTMQRPWWFLVLRVIFCCQFAIGSIDHLLLCLGMYLENAITVKLSCHR